MLRTTTAGLAARLDFTLDDIEDLRIAVGEACALVLPEADPGGDLDVPLLAGPGELTIPSRVPTSRRRRRPPDDDSFAWQVLTALTTDADRRRPTDGRLHRAPSPMELRRTPEPGSDMSRRRPTVGRARTPDGVLTGVELTHARSAALFARRCATPTRLRGRARPTRRATTLVELHLPLVEHCARRFRNRGEPLEDLVQVGTIGLIKSVDRFDIERGVEFSTYATPTIIGEIKRYFRDKGWAIRVPRRLQELRMPISAVTAD